MGFLAEFATMTLKELEERFVNGGDNFALMKAIEVCAQAQLPLPTWVADGYHERFEKVATRQVFSWDDVFGSVRPKGKRLPEKRRRDELRPNVYFRILELSKQGRSIDPCLYADVGEEFGIGERLCKQLYKEMRRLMHIKDPSNEWFDQHPWFDEYPPDKLV